MHAVQGGDYGWRHGSGKLPAYYLDTLPPVRDLGRGSPVGVEFYQSFAYPKAFHDTFFEADWSRGRILYTSVTRNGATYEMRGDAAEFVSGEPLNVTDLEVGPDGMLYFCTGGWTTDGGLYRLRFTGEKGVDSWQAVLMLQRHGDPPDADLLRTLVTDRSAQVRAAAVYVAGIQSHDAARAVAASALTDADPFVRRRAAEALVRQGLSANHPPFASIADIHALLNDPDRFVRYAGRLALERTPRAAWQDRVLRDTNPLGAIEGMYALVRTAASDADLQPIVDKQLAMLERSDLSVDDRLRLVRAIQLTVMQMSGGASPNLRRHVHDLLVDRFPSNDERWNREVALTLAYCGQPGAIAKILAAMPPADTNQPLQIHYVYALRAITDGWTPEQRAQLMDWYARATTWRGGASFSGYINLHDTLMANELTVVVD